MRISVKIKFAMAVALLLIISIILISQYLLRQWQTELLIELDSKTRLVLKSLTGNILESYSDDIVRHPLISETVTTSDNLIASCLIVSDKGFLMDHSDNNEYKKIIQSKIDGTKAPRESEYNEIIKELKPGKILKVDNVLVNNYEGFYLYSPITQGSKIIAYTKMTVSKKKVLERIEEITKNTLILTAIFVIIGLIISYITVQALIAPLKKLSEGSRIIGTGKLDFKINVKKKDEFGDLANEFNQMTTKLKSAQANLIEKERLDEQMEIATEIQQKLLPETYPDNKTIDFSAYYLPAQKVSGDYYDINQSQDRVGVIIADVAGKGVPAALIMSMIKIVFSSIGSNMVHTRQVVSFINNGITGKLIESKYATLLYYLYNWKNGVITFTNAAHHHLMIYHDKVGKIGNYDTRGIPIGVMPNVAYSEKSMRLFPGDIVITYTDGINEAMDEKRNQFSTEKLKEIILSSKSSSAKKIVDNIVSSINQFVGSAKQHDDMTMVVMKVKSVPEPYKE